MADSESSTAAGTRSCCSNKGLRTASTVAVCRKLLEERGLADVENEVRQQAASVLIRTTALVHVKMVVDLAQRMATVRSMT